MQIKINKALITISSPFQCICALEAIRKFQISNFKFVVICNSGIRRQQIDKLLEWQDIEYISIDSPNFVVFVKKLILGQDCLDTKDYDFGICGDFKNVNMLLFQVRHLLFGTQMMYVDDGFTSIYPLNNITYEDKKVQRRYRLYKFLRCLKKIDDRNYFSIFKPGETKYNVTCNSLEILRKLACNNKSGVYILGTVVQFIDSILPKTSFVNYFESTLCYIRKTYPHESIFYSPHGRSIEPDAVRVLCDKYGVTIIPSKYSVEIDYSFNGYNPVCIIGYGSTALISLKKIFPNADILNIHLPSKEKLFEDKNNMIEKYLRNESICSINFDSI